MFRFCDRCVDRAQGALWKDESFGSLLQSVQICVVSKILEDG
jgi:hypothetical protein